MNPPDEFDYGDTLPSGHAARVVVAFVFVVFFVSIFGTAVVDNFFPVEGIRLVGEERAQQKAKEESAALWDGTLAKRFEDHFHDHSRVRSIVVPPYSFALFRYFDKAPEGILVGRDHWLFLEDRINLAPLPDEFLASSLVNTIIAMDRLLAMQGVALTVLPIPRKSTVAKDFLPAGQDGHAVIDDLIIDQLISRGVTTADMRPAYGERKPEEIYFKLDTHWTPVGADLAAKEVARVSGLLKSREKRLGSLDMTVPLDPTSMGVATLLSIGVRPADVDLDPLDLYAGPKVVQTYPPDLIKWFRDPASKGPYMHVGTSFSEGRLFAHLLSHYAGVPVIDEAQKAQPFMWTLRRGLIRAHTIKGLKLVSWELPIGVAFTHFTSKGASFPISAAEAFLAVPVQERVPLMKLLPSWNRLGLGTPIPTSAKRRQFVRIPAGVIGHSGDGVASLRVKGEALGARALFAYESSSYSLMYPVDQGPFEIDIPLLAGDATRGEILLWASTDAPGRLRIDDVDLEHIPASKTSLPLTANKTRTGLTLRPKTPTTLGRRAALVLQGKPNGTQQGSIAVTINTLAPANSRQVTFKSMYSAGAIVLDLGEEEGRLVESVTIDTDLPNFQLQSAFITGAQ